MVQPILDPQTGKVTFPKAEAGATATPADTWYVGIPKAYLQKLTTLARQDGFKADAETPKGQANQNSKACRSYVLLALDMLLERRSARK